MAVTLELCEEVITADGGGSAEALCTGTSVPVYYNPLDPRESVLERDLPPHFAWIWVLVAVLFAGSLAFAYWFVR